MSLFSISFDIAFEWSFERYCGFGSIIQMFHTERHEMIGRWNGMEPLLKNWPNRQIKIVRHLRGPEWTESWATETISNCQSHSFWFLIHPRIQKKCKITNILNAQHFTHYGIFCCVFFFQSPSIIIVLMLDNCKVYNYSHRFNRMR